MKTATPKPCSLTRTSPIYNNDGTLKTGTYQKTDENGNVTGEYMTFYRNVRTQAAIAVVSSDLEHKGEVIAVGGGLGEKTVDRRHQPRDAAAPDRFFDEADRGLLPRHRRRLDQLLLPAGGRTAVFQGEQKDAGRRPRAGARPAA